MALRLREVKALVKGAQPLGAGACFDPSDVRLQNWACKQNLCLLFWKGSLGGREEMPGTRACGRGKRLRQILKDKQKREQALGPG